MGKASKLRTEDALRILSIARESSNQLWLKLSLIAESGFSAGEIVSNQRRTTALAGIRLKNLIRDEIVIRHRKEPKRFAVNPSLMRELKAFGEMNSRTLDELLFQGQVRAILVDPAGNLNHQIKRIARKAGITQDAVTSESLRNTIPQNLWGLVEFDGDIGGEAATMADFYALNYCLERSIRKLIRETLEARYGGKWWSETIPGTGKPSIGAKGIPVVPDNVKIYYEEMKKREEESGAAMPRIGSQLDFLTFGHLREIIANNWDEFKDRFEPHSREKILGSLTTLNELRNPIAHSVEFTKTERGKYEVAKSEWLSRFLRRQPLKLSK